MKTHYFTFGQTHTHSINGVTLDKDAVVKITAENPRKIMFEYFGDKWGLEYEKLEHVELEYYPKGIYDINSRNFIKE